MIPPPKKKNNLRIFIITDTYFRTQLDVRFRNPKTSGTYADVLISIDSVVVTIDGRYSL